MIPYEHNKNLKVINLLGGPGSGKTQVALALSPMLNAAGMSTEYVREYAKDCVWNNKGYDPHEAGGVFTEQDYIFAQQNALLRRMVGRDIGYVVTDTSLLLGLLYMPTWYPPSFKRFLLDVYNTYDNYNFLITRGNIPYQTEGRNQSYDESIHKDAEIREMLVSNNISYVEIPQVRGDFSAVPTQILNIVKSSNGTSPGLL